MPEVIYTFLDVWRRHDGTTAERYRCVKDHSTGRFCVQNVDTVRIPIKPADLASLDYYFFELFIEQAPEERAGGWSDSVEEAIEKFDRDFAEFESDGDESETPD